MKASLLIVAGIFGLTVLLTACGDAEQEVAPGTAATTSPTATTSRSTTQTGATPVPVPSDWKSYTNTVLGFSLAYPPDLVFKDLTGPSPVDGLNERVLQFKSQSEPSRSFAVSISSNLAGLTPDQWLLEYAACLPETVKQGSVDSQAATFCTSEPGDIPEAAIAFQRRGKMFFMTSIMPAFEFGSEFELVVASLRL